MVKPCGLNLSSMYGPVPTGFASGLATEPQMCCDTIWVFRMKNRLASWGSAKVSVAVFPEPVALTGIGVAGVFSAGYFLIRLNVNATSAALNGLPSLHFTPSRVVIVMVLPSGDHEYFVASSGTGGSVGFCVLKTISGM